MKILAAPPAFNLANPYIPAPDGDTTRFTLQMDATRVPAGLPAKTKKAVEEQTGR